MCKESEALELMCPETGDMCVGCKCTAWEGSRNTTELEEHRVWYHMDYNTRG